MQTMQFRMQNRSCAIMPAGIVVSRRAEQSRIRRAGGVNT